MRYRALFPRLPSWSAPQQTPNSRWRWRSPPRRCEMRTRRRSKVCACMWTTFSFSFAKRQREGMDECVCLCVSDGPLEERAFISSLLCIQNTLSGPHTALDSSHSLNTHTHTYTRARSWFSSRLSGLHAVRLLTLRPLREVLEKSGRSVREIKATEPFASVMGHNGVKPNV